MKSLKFFSTLIGLTFFVASTASAQDMAAKGKEIFNGKGACAGCHGPEGKGDGPAGANLKPKPKNFAAGEFVIDTNGDGKTGTEQDLIDVIAHGAAKYGGSAFMVGRPDLSDDERKALAQFVLSLKK